MSTKKEHNTRNRSKLLQPKVSRRGKITRKSDCGHYTQYCGGFNDKTNKDGREHFYHATKGWRTRCAVRGENLTAELLEKLIQRHAARVAIRVEAA